MRWCCTKCMVHLFVARTKHKDPRQVPRMVHPSALVFIIETYWNTREMPNLLMIDHLNTSILPAHSEQVRQLGGLQAASQAAICKCLDGPNPSLANGFTHWHMPKRQESCGKNWRYLACEEHNWTLSILYCHYKYFKEEKLRKIQMDTLSIISQRYLFIDSCLAPRYPQHIEMPVT